MLGAPKLEFHGYCEIVTSRQTGSLWVDLSDVIGRHRMTFCEGQSSIFKLNVAPYVFTIFGGMNIHSPYILAHSHVLNEVSLRNKGMGPQPYSYIRANIYDPKNGCGSGFQVLK